MADFRPWIEAARPKTLPAAVVPVLVGCALAVHAGVFAWAPAGICLLFALLVQVGANFANDYGDFVKGADREDRVGPRRAVASGAVSPKAMAAGAAAVFAAAFVPGMALVWLRGWELLPVGVASLAFGWAYTAGPYPLAYHGLGDVFVFVFFGLVAVGGTFYAMAGSIGWREVAAAVPVGLLATNLLVVNNYRDAATDARAGKRTLVVRFGRSFALRQYAASWLAAGAVPLAMAWALRRGWLAAPALVVPLGWRLLGRLARTEGAALNGVLAETAALLLVFGGLWALVLAVG
jgi:1,4-dihydroxy-2-naphthoate octaprenyltransferase